MSKFKKLSREEMKNVIGGEGGGCTTCATSGFCTAGNQGEPCNESGICTQCSCNGATYYPCRLF
jgi:bacteriocin-like protein